MPAPSLRPHSPVNGLIHVLAADAAQDRHQHFHCDKGVLFWHPRRLPGGDLPYRKRRTAPLCKWHRAADKFPVNDIFAVFLMSTVAHNPVDIFPADHPCPVFLHFRHQLVKNSIYRKSIPSPATHRTLLSKRRAVHDIFPCFGNIRRLVHDDRRITGSCGNTFLSGLHGNTYHCLSAGYAREA